MPRPLPAPPPPPPPPPRAPAADQTGDVGTLYRISSLSELQDFKKAPNDDYVALISDGILYRKENEVPVFKVMQDTGKLKGILVYKNASISVSDREAFSAGATSPNAAYGAAANKYTAWNPSGGGFGDDGHEGMHWIDLKVPMFELTAEDQAVVLQVRDTPFPGGPLRFAASRMLWQAHACAQSNMPSSSRERPFGAPRCKGWAGAPGNLF